MSKIDKVKFESHNLYGADAKAILGDDEVGPFPFGYISTYPTPAPIFELNTCLVFDQEDLKGLALKMAAAPEMYEALLELLDINNTGPFGGEFFQDRIDRAWDAVRSAIAKAEGSP